MSTVPSLDDALQVWEIFDHAKALAPEFVQSYMNEYWELIKGDPITLIQCACYDDYLKVMPAVMELLQQRMCPADYSTLMSYRAYMDATVKSVFDWLSTD